jgi:hypothetical protein
MTDTQFDKLIAWLEIKFTAVDERFDRLEGRSDRFDARVDALHTEMLERFQSLNDRLDVLVAALEQKCGRHSLLWPVRPQGDRQHQRQDPMGRVAPAPAAQFSVKAGRCDAREHHGQQACPLEWTAFVCQTLGVFG